MQVKNINFKKIMLLILLIESFLLTFLNITPLLYLAYGVKMNDDKFIDISVLKRKYRWGSKGIAYAEVWGEYTPGSGYFTRVGHYSKSRDVPPWWEVSLTCWTFSSSTYYEEKCRSGATSQSKTYSTHSSFAHTGTTAWLVPIGIDSAEVTIYPS